jgi:hypothetical protein
MLYGTAQAMILKNKTWVEVQYRIRRKDIKNIDVPSFFKRSPQRKDYLVRSENNLKPQTMGDL